MSKPKQKGTNDLLVISIFENSKKMKCKNANTKEYQARYLRD